MKVKIIQGFVTEMKVFIIADRDVHPLEINKFETPFETYKEIQREVDRRGGTIKEVELIGRTDKLRRMQDIFQENDIRVYWD